MRVYRGALAVVQCLCPSVRQDLLELLSPLTVLSSKTCLCLRSCSAPLKPDAKILLSSIEDTFAEFKLCLKKLGVGDAF